MTKKYKPKIYEVFLDIADILDEEVKHSFRNTPEVRKRLKDTKHVMVFHAPESRIDVCLKKISEGERSKWKVDIEVGWPTSTYHPVYAMECARQHSEAASLSLRALVIAAGWEYTNKEVRASWAEYESYLRSLEHEEDRDEQEA